MKNLTKNTLKAAILVALFCPAAFADGDMGGGGFAACDPAGDPTVYAKCMQEGDMGGGGRRISSSTIASLDPVYVFLNKVIREIF